MPRAKSKAESLERQRKIEAAKRMVQEARTNPQHPRYANAMNCAYELATNFDIPAIVIYMRHGFWS